MYRKPARLSRAMSLRFACGCVGLLCCFNFRTSVRGALHLSLPAAGPAVVPAAAPSCGFLATQLARTVLRPKQGLDFRLPGEDRARSVYESCDLGKLVRMRGCQPLPGAAKGSPPVLHGANGVSVLVPVLDSDASELHDTLTSIVAQSLSLPVQVVFVNDGSKDKRTKRWLARAQAAFPLPATCDEPHPALWVDVLSMRDHVGLPGALNAGLRRCAFDWVAMSDPGDLMASGRLEQQLGFLTASAGRVAVGSRMRAFELAGRRLALQADAEDTDPDASRRPAAITRQWLLDALGGSGTPGTGTPARKPFRFDFLQYPSVMYSKAAALAAGGYDAGLRGLPGAVVHVRLWTELLRGGRSGSGSGDGAHRALSAQTEKAGGGEATLHNIEGALTLRRKRRASAGAPSPVLLTPDRLGQMEQWVSSLSLGVAG
jgi:hypothetical protein